MTISGYLPVTGWLPDAESTPNRNSHISFGAKLSGKLGAGKRHAGFDVAGIGNVNNGSRTGSQNESAGIITEPQSQRASSRPYLRGAGGEIPPVYSPLKQEIIFKAQTGGAQPHIHAVDLMPIEVGIPHLAEQTAIAAVLSDMDAELADLEKRKDKTRNLKQAMMQELLTGRTRLV